MRARPSTQFELPLGNAKGAPVGRSTCAQTAQISKNKDSNHIGGLFELISLEVRRTIIEPDGFLGRTVNCP